MRPGCTFFSAALLLASVASAAAPVRPAGRYVYEGTVAGKQVLVRLRCGAVCSGSYVYEDIGESIRLAAAPAPSKAGGADFDESVGNGRQTRTTGHLAFSSPPGAPRWEGVWRGPDGAPQPFRLERVVSRDVPRAIPRRLRVQSLRDRACHVDIRSFEITGLADLALEDRINEALAPEHQTRNALLDSAVTRAEVEKTCGARGERCDPSALGYRILCRSDVEPHGGLFVDVDIRPTLLDARLLSARDEYDFDGGGMHSGEGVGGITVDLRDGHVLDARDLLRDPEHEPTWWSLLPRPFADGEDLGEAHFAIGTRDGHGDALADVPDDSPFGDFYLTPRSVALVPIVCEAARIFRHHVQHVPFARIRRSLRRDGPASYLYAPPVHRR